MKKTAMILVLIVFSFILVGCQKNDEAITIPNKNYADFDHIDHWDDVQNFESGEVLVFYYSPHCEICKAIQSEATQYLVIIEHNQIPIYMIHEGMIYLQGTPPLDMIETPSILIYQDNEFSYKVSGSIPILNYLKDKANQ